jgi:hypothetical protein
VAIADKVARILVPFLAEALRRQVVDDLTQTVSTILAGADAPALRLSGPPDLVAALRERLAGHAAAIDCVAADAADVTLVADRDTIIESRLQAWGERLHRALS